MHQHGTSNRESGNQVSGDQAIEQWTGVGGIVIEIALTVVQIRDAARSGIHLPAGSSFPSCVSING